MFWKKGGKGREKIGKQMKMRSKKKRKENEN
jgi:hypothetical protein